MLHAYASENAHACSITPAVFTVLSEEKIRRAFNSHKIDVRSLESHVVDVKLLRMYKILIFSWTFIYSIYLLFILTSVENLPHLNSIDSNDINIC